MFTVILPLSIVLTSICILITPHSMLLPKFKLSIVYFLSVFSVSYHFTSSVRLTVHPHALVRISATKLIVTTTMFTILMKLPYILRLIGVYPFSLSLFHSIFKISFISSSICENLHTWAILFVLMPLSLEQIAIL